MQKLQDFYNPSYADCAIAGYLYKEGSELTSHVVAIVLLHRCTSIMKGIIYRQSYYGATSTQADTPLQKNFWHILKSLVHFTVLMVQYILIEHLEFVTGSDMSA